MSTICATKRDLERIAKKRYVFDEQLFNVYIMHKGNTALNLGQEYSIKKEGDYYYLYNLLSNTGCYLDPLISIDIVCEDFDVYITNEVVSKPARGRLILKNHLYDKTTTKEEVESSDCTIKPEFLDIVSEFTDNRIIQELYIGEPINASIWYDGRYLDIVRINESFFFPTKNAGDYTGVADRTGSDKYSNEQLKDLARTTFICKVGDYLKIKNISEKTIVLQKLLSYDSYSELLITNYVLSPNEYFDFVVREDCFVVFNILNLQGTLDGYWLTSSCPSDYNFKLTANSTDITNTKKFVSKSLAVSLLASISNYYIYDEKEKIYYLNDGVGDKVLENILITITGTKPDSSNVFTSSDSFSDTDFNGDLTFGTSFIPTSDCHITVTVKFTTDSGDIVLENDNGSSPGYTLYIKGNVPVTINNKTYSPESSILFESDSNLTASWSLDSESYEVLLQYYINKYYLKNYLTESKSISFDMISDLILTVNTVSADCIYNADKKVILQLDFEPENSVKLHKTFNNKTHVIDTENQIYSSSMPNEFLNSDITSISYYTDKEQFAVTSKAFKDCTQLNTVSIEGPQLQINNEAFKNTIALNEVKGIENTLFLGNLAFYNSGLKSFHSNNAGLTTINMSAFEECNRLLKVLLNELKLASIRESAFKNTPNLKLVKLPKSVNNIEKDAFAHSGINKIVTSDSHSLATDGFWFVTDDKTNGLSVIEESVFKGCNSLKDIELPDSIEHLETLSFAECNNIQNFSSPGLKTIAYETFKDTWIEDKHNYNNLIGDGHLAHLSNTSGIYFEFPHSITNPNLHVTLIKPDLNVDKYILYKRPVKFPGAGFNYYSHSNIVSISDYGFSNNDVTDWIKPYNIDFQAYSPQTLIEHIGNYAFKNCGAKFIELNWKNVNFLGEGAFYNCRALSNVFAFEDAPITKIPDYCFYDCGGDIYGLGYDSNLPTEYTFKLPNTTEEIGDYAFYNCRQLMGIKNHALCPIKKIGKYAFAKCFRNTHNIWDAITWTTVFSIKTALTIYCCWYIGSGNSWGAFDGGASVLKVWFSSIKASGNALTAGWITSDVLHAAGAVAGVADVVTGASVGWNDNSDAYPSSLAFAVQSCMTAAKTRSNLIFPHLLELGEGAFSKCTYLGRVILGDTVTHIPDYAFYGCTRLIGVDFCKNVDWNDDNGISLFYAASNIETIGKFSFSKCKHLHDVSIDAMLKSATCIKEGAFKDSVVNYTSYLNETEGPVESFLTIPDTLTTLEAGSLGFNRKNKFVFISDNPRAKQYSSNTFDGGADSKIFLIVPEGSKNDYMLIFPNIPSDNIYELSKSDGLWELHRLAGYTIPWLTD